MEISIFSLYHVIVRPTKIINKILTTSGYQLILLNCWFFAHSVIIPPDAFVVLCPTFPKNLERSLIAMQHPYTKPKGIFWHHKELWREMLSSFVDSLFKVPYGTPIELPHASMWSKLVKIDFTSSLLMLSIAYPNGHILKDTLEDTLNRSWLMEHPKGHNPRDTPQVSFWPCQ